MIKHNSYYVFERGTSGIKRGVFIGKVKKKKSLFDSSAWKSVIRKGLHERYTGHLVDIGQKWDRLLIEADNKVYVVPIYCAHKLTDIDWDKSKELGFIQKKHQKNSEAVI